MNKFKVGDRVTFTNHYKKKIRKKFDMLEIPSDMRIVYLIDDGQGFPVARVFPPVKIGWFTQTGSYYESTQDLLGTATLHKADMISDNFFEI